MIFKKMQDGFRIIPGSEFVIVPEVNSKLRKVVDLPVGHNACRTILVKYRLISPLRVHNRQSAMPQNAHIPIHVHPRRIRTPVGEFVHHIPHHLSFNPSPDPRDTAHT